MERATSMLVSNFMNTVESQAELVRDVNGEVKLMISREMLEQAITEAEYFTDIEKGRKLILKGRVRTRIDVHKQYCLVD